MEKKGFHRKLTAILSADVAGYSRLMQDDEAATVKTLEAYKQIISDLVKQHRGRVVDSPGDNLLAEFASVVDAVQCAVAVQKELQARNAELPENRKMLFRIGVNLGDVIEEGDRIYGDGVNIAARLESIADPGGICVSKTAFDQIETKLPFGYEFLGEQTVKNIAKPVGAYRVVLEPRVTEVKGPEKMKAKVSGRRRLAFGALAVVALIGGIALWQYVLSPSPPAIEKADPKKMAFTLPDKPSIAVLPFDNMTGDPSQDFLSDGITEQIIASLSKLQSLFVIARNSTFSYKKKPIKVQQVSEELGVQYVLEGSVRKDENRIRITAQLIDAIKGYHLWADQYEGKLKDIFAVQDDITKKIITALQVELTQGETAKLYSTGTENLEAYLKFLQGLYHHQNTATKEGAAISQKLAEEAISADPNYPAAYYLMALALDRAVMLGSSKTPKISLQKAIESAQKAISIDDSWADPHAELGWLLTVARQHEKAVTEAEHALTLNPNSTDAWLALGLTLNYAGEHEEAIKVYRKGMRLSPVPSATQLFCLCVAYRDSGRYEEGISSAKEAIRHAPNAIFAHTCLGSCYALLGRSSEALAAGAEVLRIDPNFSLDRLEKVLPYKDQEKTQLVTISLRKAGLK